MAQEKKYWDPEMETMPLDKLRKLQEERLQELVAWAYERTTFYRRKFDEAGIKPSDINTLDDMEKIPLTKDSEIRQAPMEEKLAVPWEDVKRFCSSSGTTGFPEIIPFMRSDFDVGCVGNLVRAKWAIGMRPGDVVLNLVGYPCQTKVNEVLGATVFGEQIGRGNLDYQIALANMMNVTVLEQMPSLLLRYFDRAKELGVDIKNSALRLIVAYGEGWAESYKRKVGADYGVTFGSLYGSSQVAELAYECEQFTGYHIVGDCCIAEVINPETEKTLDPGEEGELVATNFFRKAVPRIRVMMSDVTSILPYETCACGRTHPKIGGIRGRMAQRIKLNGKMLFPIDIEEVIGSIPDLGYEYQIIKDKPDELDRLKVKVEPRLGLKDLKALKTQTEEAFHRALGVDSEVEIVPEGSLGHALFKAQRVITTYDKV